DDLVAAVTRHAGPRALVQDEVDPGAGEQAVARVVVTEGAHREWAEVAQVEVTDPAQGVADDLGLPLALGVQRQVGELSPADAAGAGLGPAAGHAVRGGLVDLDGVAPPEA